MFATLIVGFFVLMIFAAELFKMWRRETEYRRARARWDDDVEELRDHAWRGPGPGQRPAPAPGYITPAVAPAAAPSRSAMPLAELQTRIERELRALHKDVRSFRQRLKDEAAPEVYPYPVDMAVAHDEGGPTDEEEALPRPTH
jgi:hypothetical protein